MVDAPGAGAGETRREIELEGATVRLREDGVLHIVIAKDAVITVELVQAMHAAADELRDVPHPVLTDIRRMRGTSILTLRRTAGSDIASMVTRMAILVGSPVSRMIGNVMMGLTKPPYPARLFTNEDDAVTWLREGPADNAIDHDDRARDKGDNRAEGSRARDRHGPAA